MTGKFLVVAHKGLRFYRQSGDLDTLFARVKMHSRLVVRTFGNSGNKRKMTTVLCLISISVKTKDWRSAVNEDETFQKVRVFLEGVMFKLESKVSS